jgi:MFS family permease
MASAPEPPILEDTTQSNPVAMEEKEMNSLSSKSSAAASEFKPNYRFYLAFLTLSTITLAAALDATSLSVALPIIASKLHGTAIEAFWSGTSFLLTSTVFQPSYASFSHIFGRKPLVYVALTFFLVGAIIAALANNFTTMLIGRSLQGVGAGGIISLTEIVITDMVPLRERGKWFGCVSFQILISDDN